MEEGSLKDAIKSFENLKKFKENSNVMFDCLRHALIFKTINLMYKIYTTF